MKGKEQSFWMGYGVVVGALIAGSGFFFYKAHSSYSSSNQSYDNLARKLQSLESAPIYPSSDSVSQLTGQLDTFEVEVDKLHDLLKTFQKDLVQVSPRQFPQDLKQVVEEFREYRLAKRVVIPDPFYMGFDKYEFTEPRPEAAGILNYQLGAVNYLVKVAIENGADIIYTLKREEAAVERGEEDPELTQRVVRYPVTFSFRTTHDGFRSFLNEVSNGDEYFYLVRVLRIDNEQKDGPPKRTQRGNVWVDKSTGEVLSTDDLAEDEGNPVDLDTFALQDAHIVMGNERLKITAVIDICRFPEVGAEAIVDDQQT